MPLFHIIIVALRTASMCLPFGSPHWLNGAALPFLHGVSGSPVASLSVKRRIFVSADWTKGGNFC